MDRRWLRQKSLYLAFFPMIIIGCGLQSDLYVDYKTEEGSQASGSTSTGAEEDDCTAAIEAFSANIAPAIASSCGTAGCHLTTPIGGSPLKAGDSKINRNLFLKFDTSTDGSNLIDKIGGAGHGGGNQSGVLASAKIKAWKEEEAKCP